MSGMIDNAMAFARTKARFRGWLEPRLEAAELMLVGVEFCRHEDRVPGWIITTHDVKRNMVRTVTTRVEPPNDPYCEDCARSVAAAVICAARGGDTETSDPLTECIAAMRRASALLTTIFNEPESLDVMRSLSRAIVLAERTQAAKKT